MKKIQFYLWIAFSVFTGSSTAMAQKINNENKEPITKTIAVNARVMGNVQQGTMLLTRDYAKIFIIPETSLIQGREYRFILKVHTEEQYNKHTRGQSGQVNAKLIGFETSVRQNAVDLVRLNMLAHEVD